MLTSKIVLHELYLKQLQELGAEVIDIEGIMVFVRFKFPDSFTISYLYHRNPNSSFLLERIKPYQLLIGEYSSEEAIIENIANDIDQIKNAKNSNKFNSFVETLQMLNKLIRDFDDLFLYYNINGDDMQYIFDSVKVLYQSLYRIKEHSQRVYYKTEPQSLKD